MEGDIETRVGKLWKDAFNERKLDVLDAITAPEFLNHNALPGTPRGRDGHRQVLQRLWKVFPDAHFEIDHLARDGNTVICVGRMSGTHRDTLLGVPATARKVEWRQCHLYRFDDTGHVVEHDAIRDDAGLFRQFREGRASQGSMQTLHLAYRVTDLGSSLEFYRALGYAEVGRVDLADGATLTMLKFPREDVVSLELVHRPVDGPVEVGPGFSHLVVQVDDLAAAIAALAASGLGPTPAESPGGSDGPRTSWLTDPDGYRIELVQWPPGHPSGMTAADFR